MPRPLEVYLKTPQVTLYQGNCLDILRQIPSESVSCCVTSPPYFNLRQYQTEPQVWGGSDDCKHEWVSTKFYREGGASGGKTEAFQTGGQANADRIKATRWKEDNRCSKCGAWRGELGQENTPQEFVGHLVEIFAEVHRVLKKDGVAWVNMGDSYASTATGSDTTKSKLLGGKTTQTVAGIRPDKSKAGIKSKSLMLVPQRLAIALQDLGWIVRSEIIWSKKSPMPESVTDRCTRSHEQIWMLTKSERYWSNFDAIKQPAKDWGQRPNRDNGKSRNIPGQADHSGLIDGNFAEKGANCRDVWHLSPEFFKGEHYAAYPTEIPRRCIASTCPPNGVVLDPFAGTGTTLFVAQEMGRKAIGIELNPEYLKIIEQRCQQTTIFGIQPQEELTA